LEIAAPNKRLERTRQSVAFDCSWVGERTVNGEIVSGVLVEVFDHPDYLLLSYPERQKQKKDQRRIAACVGGSDGRFCFESLQPGKYELRFSKDGGWKHTQVYVVVVAANRKASKRGLQISMQVGT
jgi:hypothetical protein